MAHLGRGSPRIMVKSPCVDQQAPFGLPTHLQVTMKTVGPGLGLHLQSVDYMTGEWQGSHSWFEWFGAAVLAEGSIHGGLFLNCYPTRSKPGFTFALQWTAFPFGDQLIWAFETTGHPWQFSTDLQGIISWKLIHSDIPGVTGIESCHFTVGRWHTFPHG